MAVCHLSRLARPFINYTVALTVWRVNLNSDDTHHRIEDRLKDKSRDIKRPSRWGRCMLLLLLLLLSTRRYQLGKA